MTRSSNAARHPCREQDQAPEDPPSGELRGFLASLGRLAGIGGTVEDEAGAMAPVRRPGLYMSLALVLVFVFATYFASSIAGEDLPPVQLVQEPTVSQLPSGIVLVGNVEDDERNSEDVSKENQPNLLLRTTKSRRSKAGKRSTHPVRYRCNHPRRPRQRAHRRVLQRARQRARQRAHHPLTPRLPPRLRRPHLRQPLFGPNRRPGNSAAGEAWLPRLVRLPACRAVRAFTRYKRAPSTLPSSVTGFPRQ